MADISSISIEELQGNKRTVELHGGALPHKPADWSGKQTIKTTWYPGNKRASQQVLGPQESPSRWTGKWSHIHLARTPVVVSDSTGEHKVARPELVCDTLDDIRRCGSLLRVTWSTSSGSDGYTIVRDGRLEECKWSFDTVHDVGWELNFTWIGVGGDNDGPAVTSTRDDKSIDTVSMNTALAGLVTQAIDMGIQLTNSSKPQAASFFSLGNLEAIAQTPFKILQSFTRKVQATVSAVMQVRDFVASIGNEGHAMSNSYNEFAVSVRNETMSTHDQLSRTPPELVTTRDGVSDMTRAYAMFARAMESQEALIGTSQDLMFKTAQLQSANPGGASPTQGLKSSLTGSGMIAVYETRDGDTAIGISMKFYGTPDRAVDILKANRLPWMTVTFQRGKVLTIPELSTSS